MLPGDIHISAKGKEHAVRLREIKASLVRAVEEGKLTFSAKRNSNCNILAFSSLRIISSRIVMEGLPIARVTVPVEPCSRIFRVNVEICAYFLEDSLISGTVFGVFADQVATLVPWNPFGALLSLFLEIAHFFNKLIVGV